MKPTTLDLTTLTDEQRYKIERVLYPRNRVFSYNFASDDVATWKRAAERSKYQNLGDWVEWMLCKRIKPLSKNKVEPGPRRHRLSLRFAETNMNDWRDKAAANNVSFTEWVERVLNDACRK